MTNAQGNRGWAAVMVAAISMMLAAALAAPAQTFKTLVNFNGTNGSGAGVPFVQGEDGNLYGTTAGGGATNYGTVFRITPAGTLTTLYNFCPQNTCTDGSAPVGIVLGTDGNFYGTTAYGGNVDCFDGGTGCGTVFRITPGGALTVIHSFDSIDGADPQSAPVQGMDGNFYGTTYGGGANNSCSLGCGTVYKITPEGALSTIYNFCSQANCADGLRASSLVPGSDGNFYGATSNGGITNNSCPLGCGTIFRITPMGALTTLYSFCSRTGCTDGAYPEEFVAAPVQGTDGNFHGTTANGGFSKACGTSGCGTAFRITPGGALTILYSFCAQTGCTDGVFPEYGLVQANDGNFYGTTNEGGSGSGCGKLGCGTIFKLSPESRLITLHSFDRTDGQYPGAVAQATSGSFYGATLFGGDGGCCSPFSCGTVFSLGVGLSPFVKTLPTTGRVGRSVGILGTNLTGATSVTFNGTAATFTVESATAIKTTVPTGATTGPIQVVTPSGTLTSNVNFQVPP